MGPEGDIINGVQHLEVQNLIEHHFGPLMESEARKSQWSQGTGS
jgi:hypothetical protein